MEKDKKKRNEVTCKLCFQVLKYASNTTNMRFHLQTHHHREYAAMESQERARPASSGSSTSGSSHMQPTQILGWPHMPCFSHTLQLAVEDAMKLPEVSKALARCRRLVSHFNHSSKSTYLLRQKQADLHHKQLSLVQDVPTRWNSTYYMVGQILAQRQPLCAMLLKLRKGDLMPSENFPQWRLLWQS